MPSTLRPRWRWCSPPTDGTNTYTFTLPKIKFTGGKPEVGGEREISISLPFQAIYAADSASQIVIERVLA